MCLFTVNDDSRCNFCGKDYFLKGPTNFIFENCVLIYTVTKATGNRKPKFINLFVRIYRVIHKGHWVTYSKTLSR